METIYDLIIQNGTLVTGQGLQRADLAVSGERIAAVAPSLPAEAARRVIVSGSLLRLPPRSLFQLRFS